MNRYRQLNVDHRIGALTIHNRTNPHYPLTDPVQRHKLGNLETGVQLTNSAIPTSQIQNSSVHHTYAWN